MTEADMQRFFGEYLRKYPPKETEAYELKICKGIALPFNSFKSHQVKALLEAESRSGFFHKISDPPVFSGMNSRFNLKRPFDCFCLIEVKSYVVIWFYQPRTKKEFIKIPVRNFLGIQMASLRKSLTREIALSIGKVLEIT